MQLDKIILPWCKRLGDLHYHRVGSYETLCGRPMLGMNYYADFVRVAPEKFRECEVCHNKAGEILKDAMQRQG